MKIICIGRNYARHAEEMKAEKPKNPVVFLKPDTALLKDNVFYYPDFTKDLHYEVELVVRISKMGKHIAAEYAGNYYDKIGLGIDFTARDIQRQCKEKGLPWEKAKAFDNSALISGAFMDKDELPASIPFSLLKNGEIVQQGVSGDMLFSINELISYISTFFTLKTGDLIYTGTPEGVGAVKIGDELQGFIDETKLFDLRIR